MAAHLTGMHRKILEQIHSAATIVMSIGSEEYPQTSIKTAATPYLELIFFF